MSEKPPIQKDTRRTAPVDPRKIPDILMNAPIGFFTSTTDGRFLSVNHTLTRIYGYDTPAELMDSITDIQSQLYADPSDREKFTHILETHGAVVNYEYQLRRRDGSVYWVSTNAEAIWDKNGKTLYYQGFTTDIAERKRAEQLKHEAEIRFRRMFMNAPVPYLTTDTEGTVIDANQAFLALLGYARNEMIAKKITDFIQPDKADILTRIARNFITDEHVARECNMIKKDGSIILVRLDKKAQHDEHGQFQQMHMVIQDITEHRRAEKEALRDRERYLDALIETTREGFLLSDAKGRIIDVNEAYCRMSGYTKDELLRLNISDLSKEPDAAFKIRIRRVQGKGAMLYEMRHHRKDGSIYDVEISTTWLNIHGGRVVCFLRDITKRKQDQMALKESEARNRALLDAIPDGIFIFNREGMFIDYQAGNHIKLITSPDRFLYKHVSNALPPGLSQLTMDALDHVFSTLEPQLYQYTAEIDNELDYFEMRMVPLDEDKALALIRNITEQKQVEKELRESEERFSKAFKSSPAAQAISDIESGKFLDANDSWLKMFDTSKGKIIGKTSKEIGLWADPEDRDRVVRELRHQGSIKDVPIEFKTMTGNHIKARLSSVIITLTGREVMLSMIHDETERKRAEEALYRTSEKLRGILDYSPVLISEFNTRGRCLLANPAFNKTFSPSGGNAVGKRFSDLFPPYATELYNLHLKRIISKRKPITVEEQLLIHEKEMDFSTTVFPLFDHYGQIRSIGAISHDITERKKAEKILQQLNESLEQRVVERTRLAETRLKELQHLAVQLVEAEEKERRRIAELLHDDLQQILASAKMQLQLASQKMPAVPELEKIEHLLKVSITKSRLLSHELSPAVVYHSGMYKAMEWLARRMEEQFGLKVELHASAVDHFESTPLKVFLFRAVQELLFNVIKHAGVRKARVDLSPSNGNLVVTVSDQGQGFDPDTFLNSSNQKTGLGLLSLRERLQTMGGRLLIESVPGQGSRFTLTIPSGRTNDGNPGLEVLEKTIDHGITPGKTTRVLFVDDHKMMRQGLINLIAEQPGIEVVGEASNGQEAIDKVRQLDPDVVIMDALMPEMDGEEATRRIKAERPGIRVIGLSMLDDDHIADAMRKAGAEAFLSKTISPAGLLKVIYDDNHPQENSIDYRNEKD